MTRALRWRIPSAATAGALAGMELSVFTLLRLRRRDDDCALAARRTVVYTHHGRLSRFAVEHLEGVLAIRGRRLFVADRAETKGDLVRDKADMLHRLLRATVRPTWGPQPALRALTTAKRGA